MYIDQHAKIAEIPKALEDLFVTRLGADWRLFPYSTRCVLWTEDGKQQAVAYMGLPGFFNYQVYRHEVRLS